MIALPHHLPFVKVGENSLTLIQSEWLEDLIIDAAQGTRIPDWFAVDIARGIQKYLQNSYEGSVIESEELLERIRKTLARLGIEDVSDNLEWNPPPLRISLTDLARRAGKACDWGFIQLLEEKCQEAVNSGAAFVEYHGLNDCVSTLHDSNQSDSTPDEIQEQIESKIDEYRAIGELSKPIFNVSVA